MSNMQHLKAGPFTVGYLNGSIRYLRYGPVEVLRSIYVSLRGQHCVTYNHIIETEYPQPHDDHFILDYDCFYYMHTIRGFKCDVRITSNTTGMITFALQVKALADTIRNRARICILLPIKVTAANPCELLPAHGAQ